MNWKEIILFALKNKKDLNKAMEKAAKVAPHEISMILRGFPDNFQDISNLDSLPTLIRLLYFHFLAEKALPLTTPSSHRQVPLETSIHAALNASTLSRTLGENVLEAQYLEMAGNFLYNMGRFSEAEEVLKKALTIFRALAEHGVHHTIDVMTVSNDLGTIYLMSRKFSQAKEFFTEALDIYDNLHGEKPALFKASILQNLGILHMRTENLPQSEKYFKKALESYKSMENEYSEICTPYIAQLLQNMGLLYWNTREYSKAEEAFSEALKIRRTLAKTNPHIYRPQVANTLKATGILLRTLLRFSEAERALKEALNTYNDLGSETPEKYTQSIASTEHNLGVLYWDMGDFYKSEAFFTKALHKFRHLSQNHSGYLHDTAGTLLTLGNIYCENKRHSEAEEMYKEALKIFQKLAHHDPQTYTPDLVKVFYDRGALYWDLGEYSKAEKNYTNAFETSMQSALWVSAGKAANFISKIRSDRKVFETSIKIFELAILFLQDEKYQYAQKATHESLYWNALKQETDIFGSLEALRDPSLLSYPWGHIVSKGELQKSYHDVKYQKYLMEKILSQKVPPRIPPQLPEELFFAFIQKIEDSIFFFVLEGETIKKFKCSPIFYLLAEICFITC
ncbi:MAG: tetratricopeptide repeat protein [Candidatus Methanofastidiosia archaeon]